MILHKAVDPVVDGFIIAFKVVGQCLRAVDQLGDEDAEHQVDAVSYTHLRLHWQSVARRAARPAESGAVYVASPRASANRYQYQPRLCLLYTSRCV